LTVYRHGERTARSPVKSHLFLLLFLLLFVVVNVWTTTHVWRANLHN
jgi:hypothetical protein